MLTDRDILEHAREVIDVEAAAVAALSSRIDHQFAAAVAAILSSDGRVIVCGMGKSGLIGNKIAATLASTGTPSFSMHPGDAYHGDLGMVRPEDIFLAISNSGETDEVIRLIPFLKHNGNRLISMTGQPDSLLAQNSDFHLDVAVAQEACPLRLAPTASTTAALVMGDALALSLMEARGFRQEDFARFHPGGRLGRRLLTRVEHVMHSDLPVVDLDAPASEVIQTMTSGRLGIAVVRKGRDVAGVVTDGDLRRAMERHHGRFADLTAHEMMTTDPVRVQLGEGIEGAAALMTEKRITALLVFEGRDLRGIVQLRDCAL